ncbi:hypothetical protein L7F22_062098 [Adiantum nelumboides]|nr:hypothetical protein [Adiantum nelumboides]
MWRRVDRTGAELCGGVPTVHRAFKTNDTQRSSSVFCNNWLLVQDSWLETAELISFRFRIDYCSGPGLSLVQIQDWLVSDLVHCSFQVTGYSLVFDSGILVSSSGPGLSLVQIQDWLVSGLVHCLVSGSGLLVSSSGPGLSLVQIHDWLFSGLVHWLVSGSGQVIGYWLLFRSRFVSGSDLGLFLSLVRDSNFQVTGYSLVSGWTGYCSDPGLSLVQIQDWLVSGLVHWLVSGSGQVTSYCSGPGLSLVQIQDWLVSGLVHWLVAGSGQVTGYCSGPGLSLVQIQNWLVSGLVHWLVSGSRQVTGYWLLVTGYWLLFRSRFVSGSDSGLILSLVRDNSFQVTVYSLVSGWTGYCSDPGSSLVQIQDWLVSGLVHWLVSGSGQVTGYWLLFRSRFVSGSDSGLVSLWSGSLVSFRSGLLHCAG